MLSGPSFAGEVARGLPTAVTLACPDQPLAREMAQAIAGLAAGRYGASLKLCVPFVESLDDLPHCLSFEHEFPAPAGSTHVLQQGWGIGYFTLPARRLD